MIGDAVLDDDTATVVGLVPAQIDFGWFGAVDGVEDCDYLGYSFKHNIHRY